MSLHRLVPILLIFYACGVSAQEPASDGSISPDAVLNSDAVTSLDSPQTRIVTRSDLVLAPVVLTNKKGKPVVGLPVSAFHLEQDGKEQKIAVFEEVTTDNQTPNVEKQASEPDVTNFALDRSHQWRVTIVILDMLNTPFLRQGAAQKALIKYLSTSISRDEPTALFGLNSSGLHQLHPFTTDTAVLISALKRVNTQYTTGDASESQAEADSTFSAASSDSTTNSIAEFMQSVDEVIAANYQRDATRMTLEAFNQIAQAYKAVPGRKTLIWATGGFPFMIDDPQTFNRMGLDLVDEYQKTWRTLISSNVAVYPIDAKGLVNNTYSAAYNTASSTSSGSSGAPSLGFGKYTSIIPYDKNLQQKDTMRSIASATGGRACLDTNELEKCFANAIDDSRTYYMLGFYLQNENRKPGWRKLKVKVDVSGARIRARGGFYVSSPSEDTTAFRQEQFSQAFLSPIAYTGVRLKARILGENLKGSGNTSQTGKQSAKQLASFLLTLPADNFVLDATKSDNLDLEVVAIAFDKDGNVAGRNGHSVYVKLVPGKLETFKKTGLSLQLDMALASGSYELKFAVRDNSTGQIGTVFLPYEMK
jgi:VWFA-related protein